MQSANGFINRRLSNGFLNARKNKLQSSTISQLKSCHRKIVKVNRDYMRIIIECLMFTALKIDAKREHQESRSDLSAISYINRGNFLELLHIRSRNIPWLFETPKEKLKSQSQWTFPVIQNELLEIMSDVVLQKFYQMFVTVVSSSLLFTRHRT